MSLYLLQQSSLDINIESLALLAHSVATTSTISFHIIGSRSARFSMPGCDLITVVSQTLATFKISSSLYYTASCKFLVFVPFWEENLCKFVDKL